MAVSSVFQREIVEVPYQLPDGSIKPHMALVLSTDKLQKAEDGMFYAVLISSKNINPEFTMEIQNDWLMKPLPKQSYFVTHIVSYYRTEEVIQSFNNFVKKDYFDAIMNKVILSMFDIELE
ncbi:MAG: type II toxin-antitoxin system PemK/MazF family toxin [Prevotella sp.]|nr:type II toxin-antitoxin system PemK/MazF family toxin [Prevotella sp.]